MRKATISKTTLIFMVLMTIFAFRNIVNNQVQFGLSSVIFFFIAGIVYAIPFTYMSNELASIHSLKNAESGIGSWVKFALGKKIGFLSSWSTFFSNLFFFATIAPMCIISFSFMFFGENGFDLFARFLSENDLASENNATRYSSILLSLFSIILFWIGTYVSKKGPKWISYLSKISGAASLLLSLILIIGGFLIVVPFINKGKFASSFNFEHLNPLNEWGFGWDYWSFLSSFSWIMISFIGIETMGVFIKDIKGGPKSFKTATIIGTILIILLSCFVSLAISMTIEQDMISNEWGLANSYYHIFPTLFQLEQSTIGYDIFLRFIGFIIGFNILGSLLFWTMGPVKVLFSEAPDNILGKWATKIDNNGVPINGLTIQAIIVTFILIIVGITTTGKIGESSSIFLSTITQATVVLNLLPVIFMVWGWMYFRIKKNHTKRDYIFCKNKIIAIIIASVLMSILVMAFIFGSIASPILFKSNFSQALMSTLLSFGGFILFEGIAILMWKINSKKIQKLEINREKTK